MSQRRFYTPVHQFFPRNFRIKYYLAVADCGAFPIQQIQDCYSTSQKNLNPLFADSHFVFVITAVELDGRIATVRPRGLAENDHF